MTKPFKTLDTIEVSGKRVLLRADLNVPLHEGQVADTTRLKRLLPTLQNLQERGARIILLSHLGRPTKKDPSLSLKPVAKVLEKILNHPIKFVPFCIEPEARSAVEILREGEILLLENLRFYEGEESNSKDFAKQLASLGDLYINDAFSASHRAHASITGLPGFLPSAAGRLMEEELLSLSQAFEMPERPLMAIIGGAKVSTKLKLIENLLKKVDYLAIGGAMAHTFLKALGYQMGCSFYEQDMILMAQSILQDGQKKILLPHDIVAAQEFKAHSPHITVPINSIPFDQMGLDIGPESIKTFIEHINFSKTILWNGPLGAFEYPPFNHGTFKIAQSIAEKTLKKELLSIAGGGDTLAALEAAHVIDDFSYVSTAGGAFLEWLEGEELPGIVALKNAH